MMRRRTSILVGALLLVGSLGAVPAAAETESDQLSGTPAYWSYDRPAEYDAITTHVTVPTRDSGVNLGCDLYRPGHGVTPASGRFPGIVAEYTPYYAFRGILFSLQGRYFAQRGYNVIVCNIRGTGDSSGTWTQINSPEETRDNYDLIEWFAAQSWSDGRIGQQGESYGGFTSYRVAALQPPHLVAIAPQQAQDNFYSDNPYPGGIWATPGATVAGALNGWPLDAQLYSGLRINSAREWALWKSHPNQDDFWDQIAVSTKYDDIKVPILAAGGWQDMYFQKSMIANYEALKSHTWMTYGPWKHTYLYDYQGCTPLTCASHDAIPPGALLAWWDHWLKEDSSAPLPESRFTTYEGPVGTGSGWQQLADWPPADVRDERLYLNVGGRLAATEGAAGEVSYNQSGSILFPNTSVSFTSTAMTSDKVLAGSVRLHLMAKLSARNANFYAQVIDVGPDGSETRMSQGFLLASHRLSDRSPNTITPGVQTAFDFEVWPEHWRVEAGHRVRLTISGGNPLVLSPQSPVTVTLATRSSYADFPFRGAAT
ncbi:CocE/NonD family hydrolase [Streptomyces sp. NPDC002623]